jgi:hypothetical protein
MEILVGVFVGSRVIGGYWRRWFEEDLVIFSIGGGYELLCSMVWMVALLYVGNLFVIWWWFVVILV